MHNRLVIYQSINQFYICSWIKCHTIRFFNNTISVQVRYIIETKEVALIEYNRFIFPREYSGEGRFFVSIVLYLILIDYAMSFNLSYTCTLFSKGFN